jgi:trk system potassium uptake protein TrkA
MRRIVVVGLGNFGSWTCRTLLELGHEVIAVERDGTLVDRFADWTTRAVEGDATDPLVLERAGAANADAAVLATGDDLASTILAALVLRDLGVREIYAKVTSLSEARALEALDVTEAIFPEREAGIGLAHRLASRGVLGYLALAPGSSIQEIAIPADWIGKSLREVAPREKLGIQVVGVRCSLSDTVTVPPDPAAPFKDSDAAIVAGPDEVLRKLHGGGGGRD